MWPRQWSLSERCLAFDGEMRHRWMTLNRLQRPSCARWARRPARERVQLLMAQRYAQVHSHLALAILSPKSRQGCPLACCLTAAEQLQCRAVHCCPLARPKVEAAIASPRAAALRRPSAAVRDCQCPVPRHCCLSHLWLALLGG